MAPRKATHSVKCWTYPKLPGMPVLNSAREIISRTGSAAIASSAAELSPSSIRLHVRGVEAAASIVVMSVLGLSPAVLVPELLHFVEHLGRHSRSHDLGIGERLHPLLPLHGLLGRHTLDDQAALFHRDHGIRVQLIDQAL